MGGGGGGRGVGGVRKCCFHTSYRVFLSFFLPLLFLLLLFCFCFFLFCCCCCYFCFCFCSFFFYYFFSKMLCRILIPWFPTLAASVRGINKSIIQSSILSAYRFFKLQHSKIRATQSKIEKIDLGRCKLETENDMNGRSPT